MAIRVMPNRQRVPMLTASTLEDRTRPALDGSASSRLRYFQWPTWTGQPEHVRHRQRRPSQARPGRR